MEKCTYCGKDQIITKDHIPPKCLFSPPYPSNFITVPSCQSCNNKYGKVDERVRNILSSLETTENHLAVLKHVGAKRERSLCRDEGKSNLFHMLDSLLLVNVLSADNQVLGQKPAFNFNQSLFDEFLERIARGFLFYENKISYFIGKIEWKLSPKTTEFLDMPEDLKQFFMNPRVFKSIGIDTFQYAGFFLDNVIDSLWFFRFYNGIEFMVQVIHRDLNKTQGS